MQIGVVKPFFWGGGHLNLMQFASTYLLKVDYASKLMLTISLTMLT